jgi:hypothetical protein
MAQKQQERNWLAAGSILLLIFLAGRYTAPTTPLAQPPRPAPTAQPFVSLPVSEESTGPAKPAVEPESFDDAPSEAALSVRSPQSVYYANCTEARAAGAAPIREGEPGYAPHLDRDRDGIACE